MFSCMLLIEFLYREIYRDQTSSALMYLYATNRVSSSNSILSCDPTTEMGLDDNYSSLPQLKNLSPPSLRINVADYSNSFDT